MKPAQKSSPVFAVGYGLMLLLLTAGLAITADHEATVRLTTIRVVGLLGARFPAQLFFKHSVSVWDWDVQGPVAVVFAGLGALLCVVAAYSLLMGVLH